MINQPISETQYRLYGGSSVDGRCPDAYLGLTVDVNVAAEHYLETQKPYSTGYVEVITATGRYQYSPILGKLLLSELRTAIERLENRTKGSRTSKANASRKIMKAPIPADRTQYLLYGGSSVDGRGRGEYKGRTTDVNVAAKYYVEEILANPYSIGYVEAVTDTAQERYITWRHRPATSKLRTAIEQLEKS